MDFLSTYPASPIMNFTESQSLMAELFGDENYETSDESNPEMESFGPQNSHTASTKWQQTIALPASTCPNSSAPSSSVLHYSAEHISHAPFHDVQTQDISFEAMMNLALPPQTTTPYHQYSSYSYPQIQDSQFFYPWQYPNAYHCHLFSNQGEMPSAIPHSIASPLSQYFSGHSYEQENNELSLDPPSDLFSMVPATVAQDSALKYDYSTSRFSPTPSNGTTDSNDTESSSSASHPRERARNPRYVPRISRTKLSLLQGVYCDIVFRCEWESCGTVYQLEEHTEAEETAFQNRVLKHLSEHAFLSSRASEDKKLRCQWGSCQRQMSTTTKERGMVRHLQSHIGAWHYFCPNPGCSHTSSRKVLKSHSNFCASGKTSTVGNSAKHDQKIKARQ